jgi:hypothetical protein
MDTKKRRVDWEDKFFKHLDMYHPELVMYFYGKIFYSPQVGNPERLIAGYSPLDDTPELKEVRDKMFHAFENFYRENPV